VATAADKLLTLNSTLIPQTWLTASEAAAYLKVKPRTLLLWVRQRKVKAYALSGTKRRVWRFRQSDLDAAVLESPVLPSFAPTVLSDRRVI
jgi:excisionase family DNA binding protein